MSPILSWARHRAGERNVIDVIATLVNHNPSDPETRAVAISYLAELPAEPRTLSIAVTLLKSDPTDGPGANALMSALLVAEPAGAYQRAGSPSSR